MKCPFKFSNYDFEGGQDCIGIECGMHKLCGANDTLVAENDVSEVSMDANDSREKIEADLESLTKKWHEYDGNYMRIYSTVAYAQVKDLLDRQAAITDLKCRSEFDALDEHAQALERENAELRKQVDELTSELTAARNAHAQAEHEAATLRDKLGRMLDCSHEIERIGQI